MFKLNRSVHDWAWSKGGYGCHRQSVGRPTHFLPGPDPHTITEHKVSFYARIAVFIWDFCLRYLWNCDISAGEQKGKKNFLPMTNDNTTRHLVFLSSHCIDESDNVIIHVHGDYNFKFYSLPNYRHPVRQYQGVCSFVWITSVISSKYIYSKWEKSTVVCLPATTAGRGMATQLRFHWNQCLSFGKCIIICNMLKCRNKNMCKMTVPKRLHPAVAQDSKILHSRGIESQW